MSISTGSSAHEVLQRPGTQILLLVALRTKGVTGGAGSSTRKYDLKKILHFCEDEQSSSLSTEFEPLPAGPDYVVLDHDPDSTMIFHDKSLEMENPWAKEFCKALTLEIEGRNSTYVHGIVILEIPQEPCSFNASQELGTFCALSTHEDYNHLKVLLCKIFEGWL